MAGALRHRVIIVTGIVAVSMLLMGCVLAEVWEEYGSPSGFENEDAIKTESSDAQEDVGEQAEQPQETAPSGQDGGALTGEQESPATGPISAQEMAGTYSASAALQRVEQDVEAADSLPVTLQLNEAGTGTANVNGYSGAAQYAGENISFSVTMEEGGQAVLCRFEGTASRSDSQIVISGNMRCSMYGVTFASYSWTAQK